jgi:L-ribulose-5-phosphate 3-epimerase
MRQSTRRSFVKSAATAAALLASPFKAAAFAADANSKDPWLKKAIKFSMIQSKGSVLEKFELAKKCGFLGLEMDSPSNVDVDEVNAAQKKTGVVIHGVIDSVHWKETLSHPDAAVRERGLQGLTTALKDAHTYGAETCLLVPGVVRANDAKTVEECWERSTAEVKKAIPTAEKLGVKICIETVWNNFITTPEQLIKYVDQFQNPIVGAYFDISNMIKYGVPPAEWIRRVGKRLYKFDFKGYANAKGFDVKIGEGDENWPDVLKALKEVGYSGWATSEVKGGGEEWLMEVSRRMDQVLGLA